MILNETTLRELCARVANGDQEARRDFNRHVLPVVEAIAGRWLSQQQETERRARAPEISKAADSTADRSRAEGRGINLLPEVAEAICARMIAQAASGRRTRGPRRRTPVGPKPAGAETVSALVGRHTVSRHVPWPA